MKAYTRTKAVVSLDAIEENIMAMKHKLHEDTKMIAVIKANGYGHGALPIAHMSEQYEFLWGFAVATGEEALELRRDGIRKPILILGIVFEELFHDLIENHVRMAVSSLEMAEAISKTACEMGKTAYIHLALDTGMTRIGFADREESILDIIKINYLPGIEIEGMFTHFARADETDVSPAYVQLGRYEAFEKRLREEGVDLPICHLSNSAGIMRVKHAYRDLVRAGITLYGIYPSDEVEKELLPLKPALAWYSTLTYVKTVEPGAAVSYGGTFVADKKMRIGTIPVGYADGYCRGLSNKGYVLIRGKKARILGRVCMDQFMVDVTDIPEAKAGTRVTLIGKDGEETITMEEIGNLSGRFSYEFACEISSRVPRTYLYKGKEYELLELCY